MDAPGPSVVYVVDDDEAVRDSVRALLESYGMEVRDYGSARQFVIDMPAEATGCLLLDLNMPGMSGLELLDLLKARGSRLPVIAFTGKSDAGLRERVMRAGAMTLLDKPVANDMLLDSLANALSRTAASDELRRIP